MKNKKLKIVLGTIVAAVLCVSIIANVAILASASNNNKENVQLEEMGEATLALMSSKTKKPTEAETTTQPETETTSVVEETETQTEPETEEAEEYVAEVSEIETEEAWEAEEPTSVEAYYVEATTEATTEPATPAASNPSPGLPVNVTTGSAHPAAATITPEELYLMACCVHAEAGGEGPYVTQLAIANIILDRSLYSGGVRATVYQPGLFMVAVDGSLNRVMNNGPSASAIQACNDALAGSDSRPVAYDCFNNVEMPYPGQWIGNTYFYNYQ